jgi:hypothetical protein
LEVDTINDENVDKYAVQSTHRSLHWYNKKTKIQNCATRHDGVGAALGVAVEEEECIDARKYTKTLMLAKYSQCMKSFLHEGHNHRHLHGFSPAESHVSLIFATAEWKSPTPDSNHTALVFVKRGSAHSR